MKPRKHVSATQLEMFLTCQQSWFFSYVQGIKIPPSAAMLVGSSLHTGAEFNYAYKVETFEDLPVDEVLDCTRDKFVQGQGQVEDWEDEKPSEVLDQTVAMMACYQQELAPVTQPTAVEREILIAHPDWELPVLGYIDLETEARAIDLKTASKSKSQSDLDDSLQAGIYQLQRDQEGLSGDFDWHVAVKTKVPKVQVLSKQTRNLEQTVHVVGQVERAMTAAVKSGIFMPAAPGSWKCTPKWCGYYTICPYKKGITCVASTT